MWRPDFSRKIVAPVRTPASKLGRRRLRVFHPGLFSRGCACNNDSPVRDLISAIMNSTERGVAFKLRNGVPGERGEDGDGRSTNQQRRIAGSDPGHLGVQEGIDDSNRTLVVFHGNRNVCSVSVLPRICPVLPLAPRVPSSSSS